MHVPLSSDAQRNAERVMVEEYLAGFCSERTRYLPPSAPLPRIPAPPSHLSPWSSLWCALCVLCPSTQLSVATRNGSAGHSLIHWRPAPRRGTSSVAARARAAATCVWGDHRNRVDLLCHADAMRRGASSVARTATTTSAQQVLPSPLCTEPPCSRSLLLGTPPCPSVRRCTSLLHQPQRAIPRQHACAAD